MSDNEEIISDNEEIITENPSITPDIIDDEEPITSNIQSGKPKKPRTEKQIKALEKARATRKANAQKKKAMEIENKQLIEDNKEYLTKLARQNAVPNKPRKVKKKKIIYQPPESESSESEEEVIVVKKPRKKKPRIAKKKIVYESPSESSESEEEAYTTNDIQKYGNNVSFQQEPQYQYTSNKPLKYSDIINFGY